MIIKGRCEKSKKINNKKTTLSNLLVTVYLGQLGVVQDSELDQTKFAWLGHFLFQSQQS